MDGVKTARLFYRQQVTTPVLVISGYLDDNVRKQLKAAGVRHFLGKPSGVIQLIHAVEKAIFWSCGLREIEGRSPSRKGRILIRFDLRCRLLPFILVSIIPTLWQPKTLPIPVLSDAGSQPGPFPNEKCS